MTEVFDPNRYHRGEDGLIRRKKSSFGPFDTNYLAKDPATEILFSKIDEAAAKLMGDSQIEPKLSKRQQIIEFMQTTRPDLSANEWRINGIEATDKTQFRSGDISRTIYGETSPSCIKKVGITKISGQKSNVYKITFVPEGPQENGPPEACTTCPIFPYNTPKSQCPIQNEGMYEETT